MKIYFLLSSLILVGCGGGLNSHSTESVAAESTATKSSMYPTSATESSAAPPILYEIAGSVSGLVGRGLVLENNNGDTLEINGDGNFKLSTHLASKSIYQVRVKSRPMEPAQTCRIDNYRGAVTDKHISDVRVICVTNPTIAMGLSSSYIIRPDGSLWAWGLNDYGQLGDGTKISSWKPKQIGTENDWNMFSTGKDYVLAIKSDGSLWAWGFGKFGQLGLGQSESLSAPTRVGLENDWLTVSAAYNHAVAVKTDGTLWGWGAAMYGAPIRMQPVQIEGDNYINAASGYNHVLAIKRNGSLWAWGGNKFGSVGDGTTVSSATPIQIGESEGWDTIFAEYENSIAFQKNGSAWVWGANLASNPINQSLPSQFGATGEWKHIVSGGLLQQFSLGIKFDGSLWGWGVNYHGQLGQGMLNAAIGSKPIQIGNSNNWVEVALGAGEHVIGLQADSTLWAWGENSVGQLGDGTRADKYTPIQIDFE